MMARKAYSVDLENICGQFGANYSIFIHSGYTGKGNFFQKIFGFIIIKDTFVLNYIVHKKF